jgi:hypothetical protein
VFLVSIEEFLLFFKLLGSLLNQPIVNTSNGKVRIEHMASRSLVFGIFSQQFGIRTVGSLFGFGAILVLLLDCFIKRIVISIAFKYIFCRVFASIRIL